MFLPKSHHLSFYILLKSVLMTACLVHVALPVLCYAQPSITSGGTLPIPTNVEISGSNCRISEGTIRNNNQFHSFGRFNVLTGESATFTGPPAIQNIIGRVTGGELSNIDGLIASENGLVD